MAQFNRNFRVSIFEEWLNHHPQPNIVSSLFRRWAFPGECADDQRMLRLAVRDGYLNFYFRGQSIAKLALVKGVPKVSVHRKYVGVAQAKDYCTFAAEHLCHPDADAKLEDWVHNARDYVCAEKAFVDDLVGANPGVIDLEMALSVEKGADKGAYAPRMDLVIAQIDDDRPPTIAFWEAKCADNSGLRSNDPFQESLDGQNYTGPKVIGQTRRYERWFDHKSEQGVIGAYVKTARFMLDLRRLVEIPYEPVCLTVWEQLIGDGVTLLRRPGIVIGNYPVEAAGKDSLRSKRLPTIAKSFDNHRDVLLDAGLFVHEVGADEKMSPLKDRLRLPTLSIAVA